MRGVGNNEELFGTLIQNRSILPTGPGNGREGVFTVQIEYSKAGEDTFATTRDLERKMRTSIRKRLDAERSIYKVLFSLIISMLGVFQLAKLIFS